ncbi:MAG: hypothetical protein ACJAZW_002640 [Maritalea sp.]|jgi:hypothetical protein
MAKPLEFMCGIFVAIMRSRTLAVERDIGHFAEVEHYDIHRNHSL